MFELGPTPLDPPPPDPEDAEPDDEPAGLWLPEPPPLVDGELDCDRAGPRTPAVGPSSSAGLCGARELPSASRSLFNPQGLRGDVSTTE